MNDQEKNKPQVSAVAKKEEEILSYWNEKEIFRKSLEKESPKGNFVFYDGPPFATGLPHFGHMLPTTMKDAIPRFKTMQGYHVERKWGWDCHGLPIENLVEKELGLATKKDIEEYGIEKFNEAARSKVLRYAGDWKKIIPRLGRWADMDDDYRTMDYTYTESVWWSFKQLHDKGLVYKSFMSMHICPRCETTLSNFEVNQGYKDITDISVYVKFELEDEPGTYFLAWTTTPWTLPGNVALAVGSDIEYVKITLDDGSYIVAKDRLVNVLKKAGKERFDGAVTKSLRGRDLVGKPYKPLFDYYAHDEKIKNRENGWKVYAADFVTTEDGTGIVHIAPAFGADDYELLKRENLPFVQHVTMSGVFKPEVEGFAGQPVKPKGDHQKADIEIIKYLADKGTLFAKEKIVHSYPHCWRCDTPLLNYATSSWFVKVTDLKDKLIAENAKVSWVPEEIGTGRFGKWLEGARDWAVSRSRFWGAPLPVWVCETCEKVKVVGSVHDLTSGRVPRNTIRIMRHGMAENNETGTINGNLEKLYHLTASGKETVAKAAEGLKGEIDIIIASPIIRARETAELVAETIGLGKEAVIIDDRLREVQTGTFDEGPIAAYHEYFSSMEEMFTKTPPGGENLADLRRRVGEFLYDIDRKYEGKRILIVSHEYPLWFLGTIAQGADTKRAIQLKNERGADYIGTGEVRELSFIPLPHNERYELDLHRPYIDGVKLACECGLPAKQGQALQAGGEMSRVSEVFDTWYDSGSMPYAEVHYPFEKKAEFEQEGSPLFPADFIAEGLDQTRGWFYTLMILNAALFGRSPYKNVVVNGLILAEDGRKMSKSLNNYPDLLDTVNRFGADSLRYFLISSPAVRAEEVAFSEKGVDEVMKKIVMRLGNVVSFYKMYEEGDRASKADPYGSGNVLDRWILARLAETAGAMTASLERYEFDRASRPILDFVDDLSTWYLRRSRDRFKADDAADKENALAATRHVLLEFSKLMAPFMPFAAEDIYLQMRGEKESVHLEDWPETRSADESLLADMRNVREEVSRALEARAKANIKVRQPLGSLKIRSAFKEAQMLELIKDEVNVKNVEQGANLPDGSLVELDTAITPELKEEGDLREEIRNIQETRKEKGLKPGEMQKLSVPEEKKALYKKYEKIIGETTSTTFDFSGASE